MLFIDVAGYLAVFVLLFVWGIWDFLKGRR